MNNKYCDFHIHCNFSSDSDASPEAMIEQAIKIGLSSICFTDHNDFNYPVQNGTKEFQLPFNNYISHINNLKQKYSSRILINIGVEQGLCKEFSKETDNYDDNNFLDFIIGSSHIIDGEDPYYTEFWKNHSTKSRILSYFENVLENIRSCSNFDVYGHLDYIIRYIPTNQDDYNESYKYKWTDYFDIIDCILKELIEQGKGIEVNTSGLKYGLQSPNPCFEIIKRYRELHGEIITTGSDAHEPKYIAYSFEKLPDLLKSAGFKYYTIFNKRKPEFIKII